MSNIKMEIKHSWYCTFVLFISIIPVGLLIPYSLTFMNPMIPTIKRIYNDTHVKRYADPMSEETWNALLSVTMSILLVGGMLGSLSVKILLTYLTRKQVMIVLHICNALGYLIIAVGGGIWGSYEAFIIGRFSTGLSLGLGLSIMPLIVNETCLSHRSQLYNSILGTIYASGTVFGVLIGWSKVLGSDDRWIGSMIYGMVGSIVYLACAYWIEETPFQALLKHGNSEALRIMKRLRVGEGAQFDADLKTLSGESDDEENKTASEATTTASIAEVWKTLSYRRHFIGCVVVLSTVMLTGLNNILFFSDQIFIRSGLDPNIVTPATIGVFTLAPIVSVSGIFLAKCFDPRTLYLFGCVVCAFGNMFMTVTMATYTWIPPMSVASIIAVIIFYIGFLFINLEAYVIVGLISNDKTRPVCMNFGGAFLWFASWLVGFLSTYLEVWIGPYAFLLWMSTTIACMVYIIFFIPKTRGKTLEEIQEYFK